LWTQRKIEKGKKIIEGVEKNGEMKIPFQQSSIIWLSRKCQTSRSQINHLFNYSISFFHSLSHSLTHSSSKAKENPNHSNWFLFIASVVVVFVVAAAAAAVVLTEPVVERNEHKKIVPQRESFKAIH